MTFFHNYNIASVANEIEIILHRHMKYLKRLMKLFFT